MKKFWKDYWELCKYSIQFCKEHWKGVLVVTGVVAGVSYAVGYFIAYYDEIKEKLKKKFHKKEKE